MSGNDCIGETQSIGCLECLDGTYSVCGMRCLGVTDFFGAGSSGKDCINGSEI